MNFIKSCAVMAIMLTVTGAIVSAQVSSNEQKSEVPPPSSCTLATMHGTMAYSGTSSRNGVQNSTSSLESYDGHGNLKYVEFDNPNGVSPVTYFGYGTYTVGSISGVSTNGMTSTANCVLTVFYDGDTATPFRYFAAPDGSTYFYSNTQTKGVVAAGHADRISFAALVQ
jgi:hypothetical protein